MIMTTETTQEETKEEAQGPSIYFSHPMRAYGTEGETLILEEIGRFYPSYNIINPRNIKISDKGLLLACSECYQTRMKKLFFPGIKKSEIFIVWPYVNSCGIICEFHYAALNDKELLIATCSSKGKVRLSSTSIKDFYSRLPEGGY